MQSRLQYTMDKSLTIVDTSTLLPGPFATFLLQKHTGATVFKIEDARTGDKLADVKPTKVGVSIFYKALNEKKRIVKVDYAGNTDELKRLLRKADVFVTNFKPQRAQILGLSPSNITLLNPEITYCEIKGYPDKHPLSGFGAHDINILALSGYLSQQKTLDGHLTLAPIQLADLFTSYHVALRILAHRLMGKKEVLRISMLEATAEALHLYRYPQLTLKKSIDSELTYQHHLPCYHIYKVRDGYVAVGAVEGSFWIDLCHLLERGDLIPRQFDASAIPEMEREFSHKTKQFFLTHDVCATPVLTVNEARKLKLT